MDIFWLVVLYIWVIGAILVFMAHTQLPVTFGLAVLRSLIWPIWWLTGWPSGRPLPMD